MQSYRVAAALTLSMALAAPPAAESAAEPPIAAGRLVSDAPATSVQHMARTATMLRRVLSPLAFEALRRELEAQGKPLEDAPIDAADARFAVYAPRTQPAAGYGLLVFIPPWDEAKAPPGWTEVLEAAGVILIIPAKAGNERSVPSRRIPLALLAYDTAAARYRLDPERIYVGGFSGGSRVALRLALDFPDIFKGALLNSGSDPIAEAPLQLPTAALMDQVQQRSRIVFATGDRDDMNLDLDRRSLASMRRWCVAGAERLHVPDAAHEPLAPRDLRRALAALDEHPQDGAALQACRVSVARQVAAAGERLAAAPGSEADRRRALLAADGGFGELLAPAIVQWADRCACAALPAASAHAEAGRRPER